MVQFISIKIYILLQQSMSSTTASFNPSDYQFLLKSVTEGNIVSKAESLKRFNTLVITDKKQFAIYAKRVVLAIQDLLLEPKEDINLLGSTLALQIINLNPREIQYYIRTKLLKNMVKNLGDAKPQTRKTSHYCLLAYVKTYKTFDQLIQIYMHHGLNSDSWQLRQKSINSFQSILIMEIKYLNWSSLEFRRMVEELLAKTKDESQYVQKASEQCLLSICKYEQVRNFSKKLSQPIYNQLKNFCELMFEQGNLQQIKLYVPEVPTPALIRNHSQVNVSEQPKTLEKGHSLLNMEKIHKMDSNTQSVAKQSLINKIQQIRKKAQTPIKLNPEQNHLKKAESTLSVPKQLSRTREIELPSLRRSVNMQERKQEEIKFSNKEKNEVAVGRKLIDDLKNDKDWKIRLQAIQELQNKFLANKTSSQAENMAKNFLPTLIKLLADPNFKVALTSLKIIEQILKFDTINLAVVIPQLVQKISDGKIALRQNISKLIRNQYKRTGNKAWINELLNQLKKNPPPNSNIKEQILNILSKVTIEASENENKRTMQTLIQLLESIVESVCPLMDDLKTKIKIKTLDLFILLSTKTQKVENVKSILSTKLNQVYYEMFLQKITKEMKNIGMLQSQNHSRGATADRRGYRNQRTMILTHRKYQKSPGNITTSSLKKYSSVEQHNSTIRTSSFVQHRKHETQNQNQIMDEDAASIGDISKRTEENTPTSTKKQILKSFRKKNYDYNKSTQYSAFSSNNAAALPPFNDPEKELKNIMIEIRSEEWQTCSQALSKLRRIIENHSDILSHATIRVLVPEIVRLVESLRSNLSKNAVITLNDLSNKVKKLLDSDLDSIFTKLLKKTLDANSFISEEVRKALNSICSNGNQNRVVTLLFNAHTSRAVPIKLAIINVIQNITFLPKVYEKELERITTMLVDFMNEGSLEIREKSKNMIGSILNSEKGSSIVKLIPHDLLGKLKKYDIRSEASQIKAEQQNEIKTESEFTGVKKKKKQKITVFPEQFNELESLLEQCESSDWKVREKNMSAIYETVILAYPKQTAQHRLGGRIMDVLSKQISDPNVKVATNALKIVQTLPSTIPQLIQHNLSVLINQVFNCFGSHKPEIKLLSEQLFETIASHIQKWMLIQHLCNGALYGLQKSRPGILARLIEIVPSVYAKGNKKTLLNKNLYPMINKLAEQNKPQNIQMLLQLMKTCDQQTNRQFLTYLKPKAIQLFNTLDLDK